MDNEECDSEQEEYEERMVKMIVAARQDARYSSYEHSMDFGSVVVTNEFSNN